MLLTKQEARRRSMPVMPEQTDQKADPKTDQQVGAPVGAGRNLLFLREEELRLAQDLLFFGYRDFTAGADEILAELGMGRAHHRVLHFVNRNPAIKVANLLDILKITKQSLGRVLKQLVDQGYVVQKEGENDRRQRLLFVTPKGEQLAMKLAGLQTERIARALAEFGPNAHEAARRFLVAMIDADGRDGVQKLIARADRARRPKP